MSNETYLIDTTSSWDGLYSIAAFGESNTATYGQTFTAPETSSPLTEFTFYLDDYNPDVIDFAAYVMAWDGTKATGPVLYSSAMQSTTGTSGFDTLTFNTGELILTPGQQYVAFLSASNFFDGVSGTGQMGYISNDVYNAGMFVYLNNGSDFNSLTTTSWDTSWGGGDLAFKASFGDGVNLYSQQYNFTYYYGNGDSYSGYGYAEVGTYTAGEVLEGYYNETDNYGYYTIDSVDNATTGNNNYVYVTSYYDGDTSFSSYSAEGYGYSGLGSESGTLYGYYSSDSFSNYDEADIFADGISLPVALYDGGGYQWDIQSDGNINNGTSDAYDGGLYLTGFPGFSSGVSEDNGREIVIGSATIGDVQVTRKIYVPTDQVWARYLEIVTNSTDSTINYTVNINTNLGSDGGTYLIRTSDGNTSFDPDDYWIVTDDYGNGEGDPTMLHVLPGDVRPTYVYSNASVSGGSDALSYGYDLTLAPGETQIVMHFAAQNQDQATALTKGSQLAALGLDALAGISEEELSQVVNFSPDYQTPSVVQVRLNLLADDGGNPGELIANNQIGVNKSFFVEILVADLRGNAVGVNGLGLDLAWDGFILESINFDPSLDITSQFPLLQDGTLVYDGFIDDLSGGSLPEFELGQAIGVNQLERFALLHFYTENSSNGTSYFTTTVDSASLADDASYSLDVEENQPIEILSSYNQYNFTYNYGNGDFYTGYVYALEGTYAAGQVLEGYYNETGNYGSYTIDSISSSTFDSYYNNQIYITSYYDGDTGYGYADILNSGTGYSGLTSEYGWVYDANWSSSDSYFDYYNEADILGNQLYNYTYYYGNGDSYSGYGYAVVDTYTAGQELSGYWNETGNYGYYIIDSVELGNTSTGYNGYIYVTSYYDADTGFGTAGYVNSGTGYYGLTSEYGYAYDSNGYSSDPYFSYYSEADILNQYYTFTYTYGNGDSYSGYGYALAGTYAEGQTVDYGYNETGSYGFYTIDSVSAGTADSGYNNQVYVTSYYDADTGYGYADNVSSGTGYSGLTSEYGYAYDSGWSSSDSFFGYGYYEADILGNQLYNYTYYYGNGDSYSGYGYAALDTYTVGQTIDYGYNETGNYGYYTIDSVELGNTSTGYNGYVYITSYTDGDTSYAYGTTTNVVTNWGYPLAGIYGLGSEYGYAYTAEGTSHDSYFSNYYEADLTVPSISITDNSGDIFDASIKFTTELSKFRKNYSDSDFVRPNYADSSKYFDITNTGTGVLSVSGIQINVAGVTTDLDLTEGDLLINPNQSQRVQLTYTAAAAKEVFDRSDALVLFTNALDLPEFAIALSGKSTFNSDINYNGIVNTGDLGPLNLARKNYNQGIFDPTADINGDGMINSLDVSVLLSENKQSVFI
jgi:hypothetical protein